MSATDENVGAEQDGRGSSRVVIRGVRVVVLDDLPPERVKAMLEAAGTPLVERKAWIAESMQRGQVDVAVRAYAGQSGSPDAKPGTYKALPSGSWFAPATVIEGPLQ